ncbi:MAG TPA: hypothetical protein VD710_07705 [Nitrososphaeraceae archaeon]|nr:hypothetical protein [Nitrososphaeraceae archaeon]
MWDCVLAVLHTKNYGQKLESGSQNTQHEKIEIDIHYSNISNPVNFACPISMGIDPGFGSSSLSLFYG